MCSAKNILLVPSVKYLRLTSGQPVLRTEYLGAQRSHGFGQSVHWKSQNFLKHNVSCKSIWVIPAHSKSSWVSNSAESNIQLAMGIMIVNLPRGSTVWITSGNNWSPKNQQCGFPQRQSSIPSGPQDQQCGSPQRWSSIPLPWINSMDHLRGNCLRGNHWSPQDQQCGLPQRQSSIDTPRTDFRLSNL